MSAERGVGRVRRCGHVKLSSLNSVGYPEFLGRTEMYIPAQFLPAQEALLCVVLTMKIGRLKNRTKFTKKHIADVGFINGLSWVH